jgi:hypothetical protein
VSAPATGHLRAFSFRPELGALLFLALVGFALAAIGIAAGALLHRALGERGRTVAVIPMVLALGTLTLYAPLTLPSEILAGGIGLALLLWLASEPYPRGRWVDASAALVIPMLAMLVGVLASLLLPSAQDYLGVAATLLVAELLFAGWLYAHPAELAGAAEAGATARF